MPERAVVQLLALGFAHQCARFRLALVKVAALRGSSFGESAEVTTAAES